MRGCVRSSSERTGGVKCTGAEERASPLKAALRDRQETPRKGSTLEQHRAPCVTLESFRLRGRCRQHAAMCRSHAAGALPKLGNPAPNSVHLPVIDHFGPGLGRSWPDLGQMWSQFGPHQTQIRPTLTKSWQFARHPDRFRPRIWAANFGQNWTGFGHFWSVFTQVWSACGLRPSSVKFIQPLPRCRDVRQAWPNSGQIGWAQFDRIDTNLAKRRMARRGGHEYRHAAWHVGGLGAASGSGRKHGMKTGPSLKADTALAPTRRLVWGTRFRPARA